MNVTFTIAAAVAIASTLLAITRTNAIHALLYVVTSFFAVAVTFFILGASFVAALEVIVYAGAIMVLFVFVVMLLNLGAASAQQERQWLKPATWVGPVLLSVIVLAELVYVYLHSSTTAMDPKIITPKEVSLSLFSTYIVGIELASMLLLAGLVGAFYIGRRMERQAEE